MRITSIELTNWLTHRHFATALAPMSIIAGPNGCGKSSIADALAFALAADLRRVEAKGDRPMLLTEGADKGRVAVSMGGPTVTRDIASGKLAVTGGAMPVPDDAVKEAIPFLLAPSAFAEADTATRRNLLLTVMRVSLAPEAIIAELRKRGHAEAQLADLKPVETIADWINRADRGATEARGAWKAHTGETYGAVKAETWKAAAEEAPLPDDIKALDERTAAIQARIAEIQKELTTIEVAVRNDDTARERVTKLRMKSETLADARKAAEKATKEVKAAQEAQDSAHAALQALMGLAGKEEPKTLDCPHCGGSVTLGKDGALHQFTPTKQPQKASPAAVANASATLASARANLKTATDRKESVDRMVREAEAAKAALEAELPPVMPNTVARPRLESDLAEARADLAKSTAARDAMRERATAARHAAQTTTQAAGAHAMVTAWTAISAALAPGGIPGERLASALDPFNTTLRDLSASIGWRQVAVSSDIAITAGGRPYRLLSKSEKWRVDTILAIALATHSALRFVVLDEFDILEVAARKPALGWLYGLTKSGALDTAIICGTMKEAPRVPADVLVAWLGEPIQERAAA